MIRYSKIVIKRVIRTIMYRLRTHHTNNDFIQLQILKLEDINNYFSSIFTFKSIHNLMHPTNYFTYAENAHYNLRHIGNLIPAFKRTTQGRTSPSYYSAWTWNSLPPYIRNKPSVVSLKFALRSYYLSKYQLIWILLCE